MDLSGGQEHTAVTINPDVFYHLKEEGFKYTLFNVEGPGCDENPALIKFEGCGCTVLSCSEENCQCNLKNYENSKLRQSNPFTSPPIYECNSMCKCSDACENRLVQHGVKTRLEVCNIQYKGKGVKCLENIEKGRFVCEYAGEVLGYEEAVKRTKNQCSKIGVMNYIISVCEYNSNPNEKPHKVTFVDPKYIGNVGRFINHSCDPNLVMVPVRVDSDVPHLALFACKDIEVNSEITFNYAGNCKSDFIDNSNANQQNQKPCYCGAISCQKYLPFDSTSLRTE
ncbi:histone-lysine N-methyltransferase SETMAR-like [Styela clava]